MKINKSYFFILLGFAITWNQFAQKHAEQVDLISHFKYLELEYGVLFSYANDKVEPLKIVPDDSLSKFQDELNYLQKNTPFRYLAQGDKSILVVPKTFSNIVCLSFYDSMTGELLTNSTLRKGNFIYQSNRKGEFYIPVDKQSIRFSVSSEAHQTKFFSFDIDGEEDCIELLLHPHHEMLEEVFLTNLLTSGVQKIASGGLEINYQEFGLLPGLVEPDVLQSLQALPGITSREESVSYLNVRGGTHDQNLFLWDGIKMYTTSHFFGMISAFNPYMTENVSLIKNGTSSKYGDGVSSLIHMKTSDAIAQQLKAEAGVNLINVDAVVEVPLSEKSSVELSTRQSINSLWESPTYNSYFDKVFQNTAVTDFTSATTQQNNEFNFLDASLTYKHQLSQDDYLKTNVFYSEDQFSLNRFQAEENAINTRASQLGQTNIAGGLYYDRDWTTATSSQIQFYASRYNQNALNVNLLNQQSLEQINDVREIGFRINLQTQFSSNLALESGYQLNNTGVLNSERVSDPSFFSQVRNSILTQSIYSQINYQSPNQLLNLNLGGRLNHFSKFDELRIEPRFNLSYQFVKDLFLEVLAEQKSQVTSQIIDLQTDFLGVENRRWVLSDPNSRPIIKSKQISAGFNYIKSTWFINADFYYKQVDGITTQGQGFQNQFEFTQTHGSYDVQGVDLLVNKNFDPISGWISYSWSKNTYHFEELSPSSFRNNLDLRHVVSTGLSYEKNGFKVSTGFNWHSGAVTTIPSENQSLLPQQIEYEFPNANRLKDFFRLDLSSTYRFAISKDIKAQTGISFLNLLGNNNIYNSFYRIGENQDIHQFKQNGLGFTPNLLFRLQF